ncbi:MAG: hypothetical protein F4117_00840 [Acidimicrobiales bacterium]|nr:hypothetical protein [Acidimicrobiales bacterium]MYB80807.1 hypothetical protein [Acidimicrobiales bacterium]MYI11099.1 hypothetical protein [Acidimicrobiales bacterium]
MSTLAHPSWSAHYDHSFVAANFETEVNARNSACAVAVAGIVLTVTIDTEAADFTYDRCFTTF